MRASAGMTTSATQIVWDAVGRPAHQHESDVATFLCAFCGWQSSSGVPIKHAIKDSFSDYRDLAVWSSTHVCDACVWAMSGIPPNTIRMWSILWREDGHVPRSHENSLWHVKGAHFSNKSDLSAFVDVLLNPPSCRWLMALADSGQIHLLPFAVVNMPLAKQWQVRLERNDIRSTPDDFRVVHGHASCLYTAGFSKADILSGQPQPSAIYKHGIDVWREHGQALQPWFGSKQLELALFLIRKEKPSG